VKEVAKVKTRTRAAREPLSRERIEIEALKLIEREGYDGFSMRKLAAELGCEAMSIYHYFPSVAHLRDALLDRCVAATRRAPRDLPWIDRLRETAHAYRETALAYPRFFQQVVTHRMNTAAGLRYLEEVLEIFRDAGFDTETAARLFRAMGYYMAGAALDEAVGYSRGASAVDPVPADVAARDYPLITAVNPYFREGQRPATFDLGLEIVLDGIMRLAPRKARGRAAAAIRRSGGLPARTRRSSSR
jgi:AcrR family transcriptional regulator